MKEQIIPDTLIDAGPHTSIGLNHLSAEQVERLHQATIDILERTGTVVMHQRAIRLMKAAGARVEGDRVRIPYHMVDAAIASAPNLIAIYDRFGDVAMRLGGRNCYFGTGSDLPATIDPATGEHRRSGKEDVARAARLCNGLDNIDFCMSMAIASDASETTSYVHQFDAMARNTGKPLVFTANNLAGMQDIFELASVVVGEGNELLERPRYILYDEPISPLHHSADGVDKLLFAAEHNLPVIYIGAPMMAVSAPATMSGCIVQANAEALSGLVIHQLAASGAPFVYGADASIMDMRSMVFAYGAPELQIMNVALADLARHYHLPLFCVAGATDAKLVDAQAGAEMAFSLLISALNGCNLIHDVGYLESGLCSSNESIVLADELVAYVKRLLAMYEITDDTLALNVINEVGPRGSFLEHEHTLTRYKKDVWYPSVFDRRSYETWRDSGAKSITQALCQRALSILAEQVPVDLSEHQAEAMDAVLSRRS